MSPREALVQYLERTTRPEDRLLVAVSGGADSMGLLALLAEEFRLSPAQLVVAHVQHGLRPSTVQDADWTLIQHFAGSAGIPAYLASVDALALAKADRLSWEAAARRLRYRALEALAVKENCCWILTGHTADDSAETVMMRVRNGAPWYECTGIPPRRGQILRPLLAVTRNELRAWANNRGVPYREDETNFNLRFTRNHLRDQLSAKRDFWTDARMLETARTGEVLRQGLEGLRRLAQVLPRRIVPQGLPRRIGLAIDEIFRYFNKLNFIPIEAAWAELAGLPVSRFTSPQRQQINAFLLGHSPDARLPLPHGIKLLRAGNILWLFTETTLYDGQRVECGVNHLSGGRGTVTMTPGNTTQSVPTGCKILRGNIIERELWVRPWQPGERLQMRGRPVKKIAELLAEQGVDPAARPHVLVLADAAGPLLLSGGAVAERALPGPDEPEVTWIGWEAYDATGAVHAL